MIQPSRASVGNKIRELRLSKGWTQETLAEKAALHWTYIGGVERGERNIGLDNLLKIAHALSIHPSILFSEVNE
jgi:transcriptional regulator with XRE-family HTH domain